MSLSLIQCNAAGSPMTPIPELPEQIKVNCRATADLYRRIGFCEPWVGCGAGRTGLRETHGGGTFRHRQDRAAGHGNRGFSTLPQYNASTTGLQYHGFTYSGQAHDPGAGAVWEWRV